MDGLLESFQIILGGDFDAAKAFEVGGGGLGIEEGEAAGAEAVDEVDEGDFAGVAAVVEHAFTEEGPTEADAVEATGKVAAAPGFDAMGEAEFVEPDVGGDDLVVDPGAVFAQVLAGAHDSLEVVIDAKFESALGFGLADEGFEGAGDMEGIERDDAAGVGGVPLDGAVLIAHGEEALGICRQKRARIKRDGVRHGVIVAKGYLSGVSINCFKRDPSSGSNRLTQVPSINPTSSISCRCT